MDMICEMHSLKETGCSGAKFDDSLETRQDIGVKWKGKERKCESAGNKIVFPLCVESIIPFDVFS